MLFHGLPVVFQHHPGGSSPNRSRLLGWRSRAPSCWNVWPHFGSRPRRWLDRMLRVVVPSRDLEDPFEPYCNSTTLCVRQLVKGRPSLREYIRTTVSNRIGKGNMILVDEVRLSMLWALVKTA